VSLQPRRHYSFDDWLADERAAIEGRHEYVTGQAFAMTGATEAHNVIVTNIARELGNQFKGRPCLVYASDMKVRIDAADAGKYPDIAALCGERRFLDDRRDVLLNPSLIIEVLSASAEAYDRGEKFALYRTLPSLREYVLVAQHRVHVEPYVHQPGGRWILSDYSQPDELLPLASVDASLKLAEVYDKVEFEPAR
jgi:Uma2 family endonuclease